MRYRATRAAVAALLAAPALLSVPAAPAEAAPVPSAAVITTPGAFNPLTPTRILDTRYGTGVAGPVAPNQAIRIPVRGRNGVSATAGSVVLNVTVTQPSAGGYLTVYPGNDAPNASNLNFTAGQTVPNLVVATISSDGYVSIRNTSPGTVHVIADLSGYYEGGNATGTGMFMPLSPARVLDTRNSGIVPPGGSVDVQITGVGGVPASGVQAVFLNTTAITPQRPGYITVWPSGEGRPEASSLNFVAGQTVPNLVMVKVGANGRVSLFNGSSGAVHLAADVAGYVLDGNDAPQPGAFIPQSPERIIDTRSSSWQTGKLQQGWEAYAKFSPWVGGVIANVTVTEPEAPGFIIVAPRAVDPLPTVSNVNFVPGQTVPNLTTSPTDVNNEVAYVNGAPGRVHVVVDLAGAFVGSGTLSSNSARKVVVGAGVR